MNATSHGRRMLFYHCWQRKPLLVACTLWVLSRNHFCRHQEKLWTPPQQTQHKEEAGTLCSPLGKIKSWPSIPAHGKRSKPCFQSKPVRGVSPCSASSHPHSFNLSILWVHVLALPSLAYELKGSLCLFPFGKKAICQSPRREERSLMLLLSA